MITIYDWLMTLWPLMTFNVGYHCYDYYHAYYCCWLLIIAEDCYTWLIDDLLTIDDYWYWLSSLWSSSCLLLLLITDDCRWVLYMTDCWLADYWWPLIDIIIVMIIIVLIVAAGCWRSPMITLYDWFMTCRLLMTIDIEYHCYDYYYAHYCFRLLTIADDHYIWLTDD